MAHIDIGNTRYEYDKSPDRCPCCHHGIKAIGIGTNPIIRSDADGGTILQILYRCPLDECQSAFIGTFWRRRNYTTNYPEGPYLFRHTAPTSPVEPDTATEVKELSPTYHKVLSQSAAAEGCRLDQIAGGGYRKALEFLIKDYAIHKHPSNADAIKKKLLGACINEYVNDANVKTCAARAAWLGNDETHYIRKWEEKDLNDLKALLRLTAAWILNEMLTEKYLKDMPP